MTKFIYGITDANPVGDLFPSISDEIPECDGSCNSPECGYEPDECLHCYGYGHACHAVCAEPGCPCA
jgi:hypothetical protein